MGQIIGGAAKPKRCNLNNLSQWGTPAAGEHILVSSDNSMNAAGQGYFDSYIIGNGTTAATALELHKFKAEELEDYLGENLYYSFDVVAGSTTPTTQRLDVDIAAGDSFYLKVSDSTGDGNLYYLYFLYEGQSSGTEVGNILSGETCEYTAAQKIDKIYLWKGAVSTNKTVRIDVWTGLSGQINLIEGNLLSLKGATIKQAILSEAYTIASVTRDAKGNVTAASIVFPDGQTGTMAVTRNSAGAATSAVYTYGTSTYTLTITRDSNNNVTATSLS